MNDLAIYLSYIVNSIISCLEVFIRYIWYIPILGTYLGNIIFSFIILKFAFDLFSKWILGSYKENHSNKKEREELERLKEARRKRKGGSDT